ncbi:M15 family peptidase [bacterium]|nr:M15 family peptidase [bacterium]
MRLGQHQEAFSRDLVRLLAEAHRLGYEVRIGEVFRTVEQQKLYIRQGRSKTMNSMHLKKCAADLHFTKDGRVCYPEELGKFWNALDPANSAGMFWRSFKDSPHFQRTC